MYYLTVYETITDKIIEDIILNSLDEAIIAYLKRIYKPDELDYKFAKENLAMNNCSICNHFWNDEHTNKYYIEVGLI